MAKKSAVKTVGGFDENDQPVNWEFENAARLRVKENGDYTLGGWNKAELHIIRAEFEFARCAKILDALEVAAIIDQQNHPEVGGAGMADVVDAVKKQADAVVGESGGDNVSIYGDLKKKAQNQKIDVFFNFRAELTSITSRAVKKTTETEVLLKIIDAYDMTGFGQFIGQNADVEIKISHKLNAPATEGNKKPVNIQIDVPAADQSVGVTEKIVGEQGDVTDGQIVTDTDPTAQTSSTYVIETGEPIRVKSYYDVVADATAIADAVIDAPADAEDFI